MEGEERILHQLYAILCRKEGLIAEQGCGEARLIGNEELDLLG